MTKQIKDVAALEVCMGKTPGPMHLKVIDHLDLGAIRWLAVSPLMFAGFASLAGGAPGFVKVIDPSRFRLPKMLLDDPAAASMGRGVGTRFLIPTVGETLRINGQVTSVDGDVIEITVEECYVHCAKALIRSAFWHAEPQPSSVLEPAPFLAASRFLALATVDADGRADVSPKGDPAGMLMRLSEGAVWFADRPGNRRADSFRNMLSQPHVAAAALIPGSTQTLLVRGRAQIIHDVNMRHRFAVQGKSPLLAICVEQPEIVLRESTALERARIWPARPPADAIDPAEMLVEHVKLNKARGLQATLARAAVSVPGLLQAGLRRDYKTNLY